MTNKVKGKVKSTTSSTSEKKSVYTSNKEMLINKSRIRETSNLSTDANSRTDTNFESLRDLSRRKKKEKNGAVDASTRPRVHTMGQRVGNGRPAPIPRF